MHIRINRASGYRGKEITMNTQAFGARPHNPLEGLSLDLNPPKDERRQPDPVYTQWTVKTIDVDGAAPKRTYRTLKGAIAYFESMYGHPIENAMDEYFYALVDAGMPLPAVGAVARLRAVSDYGTVIIFTAQA